MCILEHSFLMTATQKKKTLHIERRICNHLRFHWKNRWSHTIESLFCFLFTFFFLNCQQNSEPLDKFKQINKRSVVCPNEHISCDVGMRERDKVEQWSIVLRVELRRSLRSSIFVGVCKAIKIETLNSTA